MKRAQLLLGVLATLAARAAADDALNLVPVAGGMTAPIGMAHCNDDRLFILEQRGKILIYKNGGILPTPFLDVSGKLVPPRAGFDERGLLGLAFHPDYASNGRFFIFYSAPPDVTTLVSFDEADIPTGNSDFTYAGIHFVGGTVGDPGDPALLASGTQCYRVPAGTTATVTLPSVFAVLRLYFVHPAGGAAGTVQVFDAAGTPRGGPVSSKPATFQGDPANFISIDQSAAGIKELRITAPAGNMVFADDLTLFVDQCKSILAEYKVSAGDPDVADAASERVLLSFGKPQFNHNGGQLNFGPDGYLYASTGDGGAANDRAPGHNPTIGNSQDIHSFLGKFLRLDVDNGDPYGIPPDNPFVGVDGLDEIYAVGMRNPWRFSFDRGGTHQLFCSDVGQNQFEEVDIITLGGNYGWNIREGLHCFDPLNPNNPPPTCPDVGPNGDPLIDPLIEYGRTEGISVTGGYVYRGSAFPALNGVYIFGDWSRSFGTPDGSLFRLHEASPGVWERRQFKIRIGAESGNRFGRFVSSFGEGPDGELYVCSQKQIGFGGTTGMIHRVELAPETGDMNCDGEVNGMDIEGMVLALRDPAQYHATYPDCDLAHADMNGDGSVNGGDIEGFVNALTP